jgi:hypothetical protein
MSITPTLWPYRVRQPMDPDAVLDYAIDWSNWLADGEAITAATWTVSGATNDSSSVVDGVATVWLSAATGSTITATCRVQTDSGRTDERTLIIPVAER